MNGLPWCSAGLEAKTAAERKIVVVARVNVAVL